MRGAIQTQAGLPRPPQAQPAAGFRRLPVEGLLDHGLAWENRPPGWPWIMVPQGETRALALATGLPVTLAAPVLGLLLDVGPVGLAAVTLTLFVGTPGLTLIGAIGAALMAALGRGGLLVAVLVLPFTIPVLVFGVSAAAAVIVGPTPFLPPFLILIALTLTSAVVAPVAGAAALRAAFD